MWFTNKVCERSDFINFLIVFLVYITVAFIQLRQVISYAEIDNLELLLAIITSGGFIFIIYITIIKINTGGCIGINEWWLLATIIITPIVLIINQLTYQLASYVSMIPWFFLYPAITIRAEGKKAAEGAVLGGLVLVMFEIISYTIIYNSWWWGIDWFYALDYYLKIGSPEWWFDLYQYNIIGIMLLSIFGSLITLILPIGIAGYYLPGYWVWRYKETIVLGIIIILIDITLIYYGGLLRTITNMGFWQYII